MKKITLLTSAIALSALTLVSCGNSSDSKASEDYSADATAITVVDQSNIASDTVISLTDDNLYRPDYKVEKVTVLDFNATWCVPCKKLAPAYKMAATNDSIDAIFYSVDIEKNPATTEAFNVSSVPTVVILTPSGDNKTIVGLDDFIADAPADANADQLNEVILKNLTELILNAK